MLTHSIGLKCLSFPTSPTIYFCLNMLCTLLLMMIYYLILNSLISGHNVVKLKYIYYILNWTINLIATYFLLDPI